MVPKTITTAQFNNILGLGIKTFNKPASYKGIKLKYCLSNDATYYKEMSHLSEDFVKSLPEIKGKNPLDRLNRIKYAILNEMGYKSKRAVKIEIEPQNFETAKKNGAGGGFDPEGAKIDFLQEVLTYPIEKQIAWLYHELDHLDKFVKLCKAVKIRKFIDIIYDMKINIAKARGANNLYDIDTYVDWGFYSKLRKGVDLSGFDKDKWIKACHEYPGISGGYSEQYKYFNNPLEQSAHDIQRKIQKIFGLSTETPADNFPKNYTNIVEALKEHGIADTKLQDEIITEVYGNAFIAKATPQLLKIGRKIRNGLEISAEEMMFFQIESQKLINNTTCNNTEFIQSVYKDVETFIKKGIFTQDAIIEHI